MFRRILIVVVLAAAAIGLTACHNNKVKNPLANVDSKQPDKALFDKASDAMRNHRYDVARTLLTTLINTYPDSEFIARAKLSIGDAWYYEGGEAALQQAENEYNDFVTFFPNMAEAAEAKMKVANIHYEAMEKPDRDYTHAKRAEQEFREMLMQYPDSKLADQARIRLLEVQEVLAEREYRIGSFYQSRESYNASIARLKTLSDAYPLFSKADDALLRLGQSYEGMCARVKGLPFSPDLKEKVLKEYEDGAAEAYTRIVNRYPASPSMPLAAERLKVLGRPVPTPTEEAIAQNKREIASRGHIESHWHLVHRLSKKPNDSIAMAVKVGAPTLADPKPADPSAMTRHINEEIKSYVEAHNKGAAVVQREGAVGENPPAPRSDDKEKPAAAPSQVNEAAQPAAQPADAAAANEAKPAASADDKGNASSSKKKKKKGLSRLNPF